MGAAFLLFFLREEAVLRGEEEEVEARRAYGGRTKVHLQQFLLIINLFPALHLNHTHRPESFLIPSNTPQSIKVFGTTPFRGSVVGILRPSGKWYLCCLKLFRAGLIQTKFGVGK